MPREKKSMIGFDPLAWIDDKDIESDSASHTIENKRKQTAIKQTTRKKTARKKTNSSKTISISGHDINEAALLKGCDLIINDIDEVLEFFYSELFRQCPSVKPLFENTTEALQARKLSAAIKLLIDNRHDENALQATLSSMGVVHQGYGVLPEHYPVVVEVLISSFKNKAGRSWTKAVSEAWTTLLTAAAEIMSAACNEKISDVETVGEDILEANSMTVESEVIEVKCPVLELSSVQDISKSQVLKNDILLLVNDNDEIDIDASEVERIDGSALQLLCALFIYAQQNNLIIHWVSPSDAFTQCVKISGMQKILELN